MKNATLDTPIRYLKGVGPQKDKVLARLGLDTLEDLLHLFPRRYENRQPIKNIIELECLDRECVRGVVMSRSIFRTRPGQTLFRAVISDGAGRRLHALWFNQPYLLKLFTPKSAIVLYGRAEKDGKAIRMIHPEFEFVKAEQEVSAHFGRVVPIYPLTEEVTQKGLRQLVFQNLAVMLPLAQETLPLTMRKKLSLAAAGAAFQNIHFPPNAAAQKAAHDRLVFDELFLMRLHLGRKKMRFQKDNPDLSHKKGDEALEFFTRSLDFALTQGQRKALTDIILDMKKTRPMYRLVQGDVGSGKTAVAAAALLFTASNGFQGALMAPTEVLAQQHYFKLTEMLEPFGVRCGYLGQGLPPEEKAATIRRIASGEVQVAIGTHALIQKSVIFHKLGLAVVDEQHKFGVFQRSALKEKAVNPPHFLLMTATPIPRTLSMTLYGDLDISTIGDLPEGRKPVKTLWVEEERRADIYRSVDALLDDGSQAYVLCPAIDSSGPQIRSALESHAELQRFFSHRKVGLLHGQMRAPEKKKVMEEFKAGSVQVLVSTVVIEVGVDVPNACIMIIENAERFGLAQLHQLRGRIGRGTKDSMCVLFSNANSDEAAERLGAFQATTSGFDIAEKDLEIRGGGDLVGEKQHGLPELRLADLTQDSAILELAAREAEKLLARDPELSLQEHRPLRRALLRRFAGSHQKNEAFYA